MNTYVGLGLNVMMCFFGLMLQFALIATFKRRHKSQGQQKIITCKFPNSAFNILGVKKTLHYKNGP